MTDHHNPLGIDTGDTVFHRPSRETWLVAFVRDDRLAWCGWPEGWANVGDCMLVDKASDAERSALLREMAMRGNDMRQRYAQWRLKTEADHA